MGHCTYPGPSRHLAPGRAGRAGLDKDIGRKDTEAMGLFSKVFGSRSQREVKALTPLVDKIEALG